MIGPLSTEDLIERAQWRLEENVSGYKLNKALSIIFLIVAVISASSLFIFGASNLLGVLSFGSQIGALVCFTAFVEYGRAIEAGENKLRSLEEGQADEVLKLEMPDLYLGNGECE